MRIGIGYDIHKLVSRRKLFLGGVEIPYKKGLAGHSDADVLLHAISDAILGACGEGDIGDRFSDTDIRFKNISSAILLKRISKAMKKKAGFEILNIDTVVICDKPNLSRYKKKIKQSISKILNIDKSRVNIKAKTTEKTQTGTISSYAVVLIKF